MSLPLPASFPRQAPGFAAWARFVRRGRPLLPGLALVAGLGLVAQALATVQEAAFGRPWLEGLVVALLLGIAIRNLHPGPTTCDAGAAYAGKQGLELAVLLLGASIDASALAAGGGRLAALTVVGVASALILGFLIGRLLGLRPRLAFLVATGNAICGNSAIAAVAPIIRADKSEVAASIALTAVLGVSLALALPALIPLTRLSAFQYGVVAGMGVYAVPQVLAATIPVSALSAQVATTVKLGRVMLLGPLVAVVGLVTTRSGDGPGARPRWLTLVPWFVFGFMVLAALRTAGAIPETLIQPTRALGNWLTVLAMAGLGFSVRLAAIRTVGFRVALAATTSLVVMIILTLALIVLLGIDG
jgi:uncharacterized integral membrane protein (TIGR00698 family)